MSAWQFHPPADAGTGLRHFLDIAPLPTSVLREILDLAVRFKAAGPHAPAVVPGRTLAMIFEKPSTRTRVSFQVAMQQLGGQVVTLGGGDSQISRGETLADTARVLSRYVDAIMIRTGAPRNLEELVAAASVPVINGLTDASHPCQIMADILTVEEHRGAIEERKVAWLGDGNNVAASWMEASSRFGFELRIATPPSLAPSAAMRERARGARLTLTEDPVAAVRGADVVVTDTWVSMGQADADARHALCLPYQVNEALMAQAAADAIFLHCLPAHRGEEVTAEVLDGPRSVVFDEAENRLHVQKAILAWCLEAAHA